MKNFFLIVGLGNPGKEYENTRHNVGFMFIDSLILDKEFINKFGSLIFNIKKNDNNILFIKPQKYMNLSGECLRDIMNFYKVDIDNVIIIFDDVNFPVGKIKIKRIGSSGGHNGILNIIDNLGTQNFKRIKIGVGNKVCSDFNLRDWVLSDFNNEEKIKLKSVFNDVKNAIDLILENKVEEAMNKYN